MSVGSMRLGWTPKKRPCCINYPTVTCCYRKRYSQLCPNCCATACSCRSATAVTGPLHVCLLLGQAPTKVTADGSFRPFALTARWRALFWPSIDFSYYFSPKSTLGSLTAKFTSSVVFIVLICTLQCLFVMSYSLNNNYVILFSCITMLDVTPRLPEWSNIYLLLDLFYSRLLLIILSDVSIEILFRTSLLKIQLIKHWASVV